MQRMVKIERAIVVGASAGIGRAIVAQLLAGGSSVALVARRREPMAELAAQYPPHVPAASGGMTEQPSTSGRMKAGQAFVYEHDVTHYSEVPALFQEIAHDLGGLDTIIYASGVLPPMEENEYTFSKDREVIEVNVLGAFAWLDEAARRFGQLRSGTMVGISSVSGERGRRGNPAYGSSKAALTSLMESYRNRLSRYGVHVVTIKPGFIDTAMTKGKPGLLWLISADEAAKKILSAIRSGKNTAYIPGQWRLVSGLLKIIPSFVFRRLPV